MNSGKPHRIGDIIRYGEGSTSLMQITAIEYKRSSDPKYYGNQYFGVYVAVYDSQVVKASEQDLNLWKKREKKRN